MEPLTASQLRRRTIVRTLFWTPVTATAVAVALNGFASFLAVTP